MSSLPSHFAQWNKAMRGSFLKGVNARLANEPIGNCPYDDKRKYCGRLTWSRAFIACWRDGWNYADSNRADALITVQYSRHAMSIKRRRA